MRGWRGMGSWDEHGGEDLLLPPERETVERLARSAAQLLGRDDETTLSVIASAMESAIAASVAARRQGLSPTAHGRPTPTDPRTTRWLAEQLRRQQRPPPADEHEREAAELLDPLVGAPYPLRLRSALAGALRRAKAHVYDECQRMAEEVAATLRHLGYLDSAHTVDDLAAAFEETAARLRRER
jgi:hypothetical protein